MTPSIDLKNLIAAWYHHDRLGAEAEQAGDRDKSDAATEKAHDILMEIADYPVTTCEDICLKLAIAADAYVGANPDRDNFTEHAEPPANFLWQSLLDARRIIARRRDVH